MTNLLSPEKLLECLTELYRLNEKNYVEVVLNWLREYDVEIPIWPQFTDGKYESHLLAKNSTLEIYLFSWGAASKTEKHGHPEVGCWLKVLQGFLFEKTSQGTNLLNKGDIGFLKGSDGVHSIISPQEAYSLHIYIPGRI